MDTNGRPDDLRQLDKETDELLDKLEEVGNSNEGNRQKNRLSNGIKSFRLITTLQVVPERH